jgi:predicted RND superfamily exporter protein
MSRLSGRRLLAPVLIVAALLGLIGTGLAKLDVQTGVDSFVPSDAPETKALGEVSRSFGGDPVVVLAETKRPGGAFQQRQLPKLLTLEGELSRMPDVASVYGPATVLNQIAGQAQKLLAELSGYRDGLRAKAEQAARDAGASGAEAADAGRQATVDFDSRYGSLLAKGLPGGLPTLHNDRFVRNVVFNAANEPRPQWHFVVPSSDSVAVLVRPREGLSQEAGERLVSSVRDAVHRAGLDTRRITVSGAPTVVSALGSQVRQEIPLLGAVALLAVGAWFVFLRWTRRKRRLLPLATTVTATALTLAVFGWLGQPISLGVVAFLPILLGVGSDFMTYLHRTVDRRVVATIGLATAASFGALTAMPIPVVRELGITLAIGMVVAVGTALLVSRFAPSASDRETPRAWRPSRASKGTRIAAGALAGALAIGGWAALSGLPLKADLNSFAADLPAVQDARHVQSVLGSTGELDIVLTGNNTVSTESLDWMRRAQDAVIAEHGDQMRPTLSPPTLLRFLGSTPTNGQLNAALKMLPSYLTSSVIRDDDHMSLLSFGVDAQSAQQVGALRDSITRILPPPPDGMRVRVTGLPVVATAAQEQVSAEKYQSNVLGIVAAGAALVIGLRRRSDAVRAIAAAVLATGLGLLGMWLAGIALTPITVAVGSLTAAVGCEFTVVLAEAARRGDARIRQAVFLAAAVSATGYSVLVLSGLSAVREFGLLLASTVALSFASAYFVVWLTQGGRRDLESPAVSVQQYEKEHVGAI